MARARSTTINFATQEFKRLHGFLPRGTALWVFYLNDAPATPYQPFDTPVTYTEAKQAAVAEAKRRGVTGVRLDPNPQRLQLLDGSPP